MFNDINVDYAVFLFQVPEGAAASSGDHLTSDKVYMENLGGELRPTPTELLSSLHWLCL